MVVIWNVKKKEIFPTAIAAMNLVLVKEFAVIVFLTIFGRASCQRVVSLIMLKKLTTDLLKNLHNLLMPDKFKLKE
ncbi:MAG: hypothetical protein KKA84_04765 [Bacteroidetes bacterium]|nr:hypothetical protein [Bacteroidota bacterium]